MAAIGMRLWMGMIIAARASRSSFFLEEERSVLMVELVILACLLKEPQHCERFHIPFQRPMNMAQCLWQSQVHAAEWAGQHPSWMIRRFACEMPKA